MLPRTIDGMKHVCYFRHALALDERRDKFLPVYAYGGTTEGPAELDYKNPSPAPPRSLESELEIRSLGNTPVDPPQTIEVWFAGTHSDM